MEANFQHELEKSWFISDLHLNHYWKNSEGVERGVTLFERKQFKNIDEHDQHIRKCLLQWAANRKEPSILWILGDFGNVNYLYMIDEIRAFGHTVRLLYGNHDRSCYFDEFCNHFDDVYLHSVFLTERIILSHRPIYPCPSQAVNVHGHLHGAILDDPHYLCASAHVIDYQPFSYKKVAKQLGRIKKDDTRFLTEPYRELYKFTQPKYDVVCDKKGRIKLKDSIKKFNSIHDTEIV